MGSKKSFLWPVVAFYVISAIINLTAAKYVVRLRSDSQCPMAGYFRDETDCRKFYRCAEHPTGVPGQNFITKAEFNCPHGTIFDETLSSCNHIMFVRDIPSGCDVSGAVMPGSSVGMGDTGNGDGSYPPLHPGDSSHTESTTPPPASSTAYPPLVPPEHSQMTPVIGDGGIKRPPMPGDASDGDQQVKPSIPDLKPPTFPQFPAISVPQIPGIQIKPPMIPSLPSLPGDPEHQSFSPSLLQNMNMQQNHQQGVFPSFNLPSVSGSPQLPQISIPSNFNFPGISTVSNGQLPLNNLNNGQVVSQIEQNNLQSLAGSPGIVSTPVHNEQSENNVVEGGSQWVTPQQFPSHPVVQPQPQESGGWVVPDNFPTFYSTLLGSPLLLSARTAYNPTSMILI